MTNGTPVAGAPTAGWRNRITGAGEEAPDQLLANPANWRIHPKAQQDALAGALDTVGWVQQVMVNRRTGFVVDGHARVALALTRGEATVPVLYVDLDPDEEALVLATLDPISAMAGRDDDKLRALLAEITLDDAGLLALLGDLAGNDPKAGLTDPDEVPETPEEPNVKPGELYVLGEHRLLCGDATKPTDVERLLNGAAPTLLATDPPYGVQLDQTWRDGVYNGPRKRVRGWGVVAGAAKPYMMRDAPSGQPDDPDATPATRGAHGRTAGHRHTTISGDVRADWSEAFALVPSLQVGYVWYASAHTQEVLSGLLDIGFELAQQIIWDKGLFSIGRSWYHWAHEPCFVVRKPGVPNLFIGERDQATIWRAPSPKRIGSGSKEEKQDHPTQKLVVLSEIPIRNHLRAGEAVYEPFSGSGTTLMAAETLGRRCYAMEIDPKYVQVAIERWQNFTGGTAERVDSDGTFADGRHRKLHANPCEDWGKRARLGDEVWEEPILAQLEGIELDDATISAVVASLGSGPRPVTLDRARIERQIRELALEHAAGRLEDAVYLERLHELRDAKENLERTSADGISPERAVAWLRALSATWRAAEVPAEKADLLHAIYDRIVVAGRRIVSVRLTPSAYAHGFALALPEKVAVARPTVSDSRT